MRIRTEIHGYDDSASATTEEAASFAAHNPALRDRIKDLLSNALQIEIGLRRSFIEVEGDVVVRNEVLRLIEAHERAGTFMGNPSGMSELAADVPDAHASDELLGSSIGNYRLLRLIGEGGFGRVYLAEQSHPVKRQVALKILKIGMDTRQVVARFDVERQALATLDHPGIARVIDGGSTANGRPYFVMEHVDGLPITTYCDEHRLSISQRLKLLTQLCAAVQYAHMKGIIHRDLKPSNLLVVQRDGVAAIKVIDFGIAKATSTTFAGEPQVTQFRQMLGTPEYMSPEQADFHSGDIDTRADVYSLGVVLYELLCGSTPLDASQLRSTPLRHLQQFIGEHEPPTPASRVANHQAAAALALDRSTTVTRLVSELRGDLDWIALKAVDPDRDHRYSSPIELASDIRRHESHEPVSASPRGFTYRLRKFVRRNRAGVAAVALITITLIGGSIGTAIGMIRASIAAERAVQAADQASQMNQFLTEMLTSVDPDRGRGADVRFVEVLANASDKAGQRFDAHPGLEAEVRERLGDVYARLALSAEAIAEYKRAATLYENMYGAADERTLRCRTSLLSTTFVSNRGTSLQSIEVLVSDIERALGQQHRLWMNARIVYAQELSRRRSFDQAKAILRELSQHVQTIGASEESQLMVLRAYGIVMQRDLSEMVGQEKLEHARTLEPILRELAERSQKSGQARLSHQVMDQVNWAETLSLLRRNAECAAICKSVLAMSLEKLGTCHSVRAKAMHILAVSLIRQNQVNEAADWQLHFLECKRNENEIQLVAALSDTLLFLDRAERWREAELLAGELVQRMQDLGGGHGPFELNTAFAQARFISMQGRLDEADARFAALLPRIEEMQGYLGMLAFAHMCYGAHMVQHEQFQEAELHLHAAAEALGDVRYGTHPIFPDNLILEYITLYSAWDRQDLVHKYERLREEALNPSLWEPTAIP